MISIVAPCILKSTQFAHQQMHCLLTWLKVLKFTSTYPIISLLHVSVFNDNHQGALSVRGLSYVYVKTLVKITSVKNTRCFNINITLVSYR